VVDLDAPKLTCSSTGANIGDQNVYVKCEVNSKPAASSMKWIVDSNGTSIDEGQVFDDFWTFITVC
jgi:hypothetical protein